VHAAFDVDAVAGVVEVDLGPVGPGGTEDWSGREVAAAELRRWLHQHASAGRIVVAGARVLGSTSLDLSDLRLEAALVLRDCLVECLVDLDHAAVARLQFEGSELRQGLRLEGATVAGGLWIIEGTRLGTVDGVSVRGSHASFGGPVVVDGVGTRCEGGLWLASSSVTGHLTIGGGAQVAADDDGRAVDASDATITQSVTVDGEGTRLDGGMRLSSAQLGGHLLFGNGAHVAADPSAGWALDADPLTVAGDLFISGEGTRLAGGLRLNGARFGGSMAVYDGASVGAADDGWSVAADNLTVPQSLLFVDDVRLEGGVRVRAGRIGQQLGIDARIGGEVVLEGTHVAILKTRGARIDGLLDLSHARLGRLDDDPLDWQQMRGGWRLAGITLETLSGTLHDRQTWSIERRIRWLEADQSPSRRPFSQVAEIYRRAGHRDEARKVAIAGEKATSSWWRRLWAGATIGYGYQPWRVAVAAVALVALAWAVTAPLGDAAFLPTSDAVDSTCPDDYPCLNRALYLTETVVPVFEFGQRENWRIDPRAPFAAALQSGQHLLDGLGWALALLLLGAVSGIVRRE
jgi:hypothetical protein